MMNKVLTIGSFSLAVPSFVFIFTNDTKLAVIVLFVTLFACVVAFSFENLIRRSA